MRDAHRPTPARDLDTPEEIAEMVRRFYADVAQDDLLGPMFNDVARVDWSEHLPKLTAFWCRALLDLQGYTGNPFRSHAAVHGKRAFTPAHFERWLELFHETLGLGWTGPRVERARELADNVARVHSHQLIGRPVTLGQAPSAGGDDGRRPPAAAVSAS
jgi:hemoglobin